MKALKIQLDPENLNYFIITDSAGNFVKNETGKKHRFETYKSACDVKDSLNGLNPYGANAIRKIFSI